MSFRRTCLAVLIALTMLGPLSSSLMSRPAVFAAQDEDTPTVEELLEELGSLRETLTKTRKDRDKYKARLEKANDQIADLEATIAALKTQIAEDKPEPTSKPTRTPKPDNSATAAELQYWRDMKDFSGPFLFTVREIIDFVNSDEFRSADAIALLELEDMMQPLHTYWIEWQNYSPPTERLEAYHQAMTDTLYNYDQATTQYELFISTVDTSYLDASGDFLSEGAEALGRANKALDDWERASGTKVADI